MKTIFPLEIKQHEFQAYKIFKGSRVLGLAKAPEYIGYGTATTLYMVGDVSETDSEIIELWSPEAMKQFDDTGWTYLGQFGIHDAATLWYRIVPDPTKTT